MQALVFGDLHGSIATMYDRAAAWERENDRRVDVILQVGDFGVYPVPERQEPDKILQYGPGEYSKLAAEGWKAPIQTFFCKGNNEDFDALTGPLLPGLHYVPDGTVLEIGSTRIGFIGGAWSPKTFDGRQFKAKHFTRESVEALRAHDFDVLISHEAPGGLRFPGRERPMGAPPLRKLVEEKQPKLLIHGHHHQHHVSEIGLTKVISLCRLTSSSPANRCMFALEL
jgi:Icc-related predicted phosphoesterase